MLTAEELRKRADEGLLISEDAKEKIRVDDEFRAQAADDQVAATNNLFDRYRHRMEEHEALQAEMIEGIHYIISCSESLAKSHEQASAAARLLRSAGEIVPNPQRLSVQAAQDWELRTLLQRFQEATRGRGL
jgi:hypothetical protein